MTNLLQYWRYHLDPGPILATPRVPLASTLMNVSDNLATVLNLLNTLSDDRAEREQRQASTLRTQLRAAGIEGVVIDGDQSGHYRLILC